MKQIRLQQLITNPKYHQFLDDMEFEYDTSVAKIKSILDKFQCDIWYSSVTPNNEYYSEAGCLSCIIEAFKDIIEQNPELEGRFKCIEINVLSHDDELIPDVGYIMYRLFLNRNSKENPSIEELNSIMGKLLQAFRYGDDACSWYKGFHDSSREIIIYQEIGY